MYRNVDWPSWTLSTSGSGTVVRETNGILRCISPGGVNAFAFVQHPASPRDIGNFRCSARSISGRAGIALGVNSGSRQCEALTIGTDWQDLEVEVITPPQANDNGYFRLAVGMFTDRNGEVLLKEPKFEIRSEGVGSKKSLAHALVRILNGVASIETLHGSWGISSVAWNSSTKQLEVQTKPTGGFGTAAAASAIVQRNNVTRKLLATPFYNRNSGLVQVEFLDLAAAGASADLSTSSDVLVLVDVDM